MNLYSGVSSKPSVAFHALVLAIFSFAPLRADEAKGDRFIPHTSNFTVVITDRVLGASPIDFPLPVSDRSIHQGATFRMSAPEELRVSAGSEFAAKIAIRIDVVSEGIFAQDNSPERPMIVVLPVESSHGASKESDVIKKNREFLKAMVEGRVSRNYPLSESLSGGYRDTTTATADAHFKRSIYLPPLISPQEFEASIRSYEKSIADYCEEREIDFGFGRGIDDLLARSNIIEGTYELELDLAQTIDSMSVGTHEFDLSLIYYQTRGVVYYDSFERGHPVREPDPPLLKTHVADTVRIKVLVE